MGKLFGTDGIRGVANVDLTAELAMKTAKAAAFVLNKQLNKKATVLIGTDTRISADMLTDAMAAGFTSLGADVLKTGIVPTPAIPILLKQFNADIGVMISASHNPAKYNGIKIFDKNGFKLPDAVENEIEGYIFNGVTCETENVGKVTVIENAADFYVEKIRSFGLPTFSKKFKIAVDCSNGAASVTAKKVFKDINADFEFLNTDFDGYNINKDCGSIHIDLLGKKVAAEGYDLGIAFDGDADRCLLCDEKGRIIDGDRLIAAVALYLKQEGKLNKNKIAVTTLSNMGFLRYMKENGVGAELTNVGDRYVLEAMKAEGLSIGGEQSGHIILLDRNSTGDGEMTAMAFLCVIAKSNRKASEYYDDVSFFPQISVNIKAEKAVKDALVNSAELKEAAEKARETLKDSGRVIIRPSGTEPLVRIMVEGEDKETVLKIAEDLKEVSENFIKISK